MRKILIGDIHGDYDALKLLLEEISFNENNDKLIILGDFIDKGEKVYEVIEYFYHMKNNLILIKGNHEYEFLNKNFLKKPFLFFLVCNKTIKSFKKHNKKINYFDNWLNQTLINYYVDEYFQCCHASIKKEKIEDNKVYTLVVNRINSYLNKYNGKLTIIGHLGLREPTYFPGKEKKRKLLYDVTNVLPHNGIISIDTIKGKKLTAMIIENNNYTLKYVERG